MPDRFPHAASVIMKDQFVERYKVLLGEKYPLFLEYSISYITKAIRVNTLKASVHDVKERLSSRWNLRAVPWCKEGFWITFKGDEDQEERYDIGNLLEHMLGYVYVQDPASMIPPVVLDPRPGDLVLDLCAAPGSKSSQIAQYMKNLGILVANDIKVDRIKALGMNLQRCGVSNAVLTQLYAQRFVRLGLSFDKVLVDAPCGGTGTIRRNPKILTMWSMGLVKRMAREQQSLLLNGFRLLKPGGTLVYSTCTHDPEENEANVSWLLENHPDAEIEEIDLPVVRSPAITSWAGTVYDPRVKRCLRIYNFDNDTEGFFVAKVRKKGM